MRSMGRIAQLIQEVNAVFRANFVMHIISHDLTEINKTYHLLTGVMCTPNFQRLNPPPPPPPPHNNNLENVAKYVSNKKVG